MSSCVRCLFCFSNWNQAEGYRYQGEKGRRDHVYMFLRQLLGITLPFGEDFDTLKDNSFLPLCVSCALIFRNLSGLHSQLIVLSNKINSVVQEIRDKIENSDKNDHSALLTLAVNCIEGNGSSGSLNSSCDDNEDAAATIAWIQKFRQKVMEKADVPFVPQNLLFGTSVQVQPVQILVDHQGQEVTVLDTTARFYFDQEGVGGGTPCHQGELEVGYNVQVQDCEEEQENEVHSDEDCDDRLENDMNNEEEESDDSTYSRKDSPSPPPLKTRSKGKRKGTKMTSSKIPRKKVKQSPSKMKESSPRRSSDKNTPTKTTTRKSAIESRKFKCHLCPWSFDKGSRLRMHMFTHSGIKAQKFICHPCNLNFNSRKVMREHNSVHHGAALPYKCTLCPAERVTSDALKYHIKVAHDDKLKGPPWICTICNKEFLRKLYLRRHILIHEDSNRFPCVFCDSKSNRRQDMMTHMMRKHKHLKPEPGKTFPCNKCPSEFEEPLHLINHMWSHAAPIRLTCRPCDIVFTIMEELTKHNEQVHGVEIPNVKCPTCGISVVSESLLKQHMKIHQTNKPRSHECEICNKMFYTITHRNMHIRNCHQPKGGSFSCTLCDKSYTRQDSLHKHTKRSHKETIRQQPKLRIILEYRCKECDQIFDEKSLQTHVKTCGKQEEEEEDSAIVTLDKSESAIEDNIDKPNYEPLIKLQLVQVESVDSDKTSPLVQEELVDPDKDNTSPPVVDNVDIIPPAANATKTEVTEGMVTRRKSQRSRFKVIVTSLAPKEVDQARPLSHVKAERVSKKAETSDAMRARESDEEWAGEPDSNSDSE